MTKKNCVQAVHFIIIYYPFCLTFLAQRFVNHFVHCGRIIYLKN